MGKIIRRTLTVLLIVTSLLTAAIVGAAIQTFDGKGEWHTSDDENASKAMARAQQRAKIDAQKKAGVYLQTFSHSVNSELAEDAISAVTNNILEVVGKVNYDKKIIPLSDSQTTILYTATLKAKIDPEGIYDWIKRDDKEKVTIIQQNNDLQDAIQKNDELAENLTEQYNRATSQAERDRIIKQINDADRYFLANQKIEEGLKCIYQKYDYDIACRLFNEAIEINPNYAMAYYHRGQVHHTWSNLHQAIDDYQKSIKLNPNYSEAHRCLGDVYVRQGSYQSAIDEYDKALKLEPENGNALVARGYMYKDIEDYQNAIPDFTKLIELHLERINAGNLSTNWKQGFRLFAVYYWRAHCYRELNLNEAAKADEEKEEMYRIFFSALHNEADEISPGMNYQQALSRFDSRIKEGYMGKSSIEWYYYWRGYFYQKLNRYTEAIADFDEAIKINPNHADIYQARGLCYQQLGDEAKAQADFAKAKELGYNG